MVQAPRAGAGTEPIGTSHFDSKSRMTVPRGTSAMVSILSTDTEGEVVYFYDAESPRGNATYPFRAVRVVNPTKSALESGPVTVFGDGKFIGEGMCDPIPGEASAFIPFALDRQIVVERKDADVDHIARVLTVQRGVFSTEVQHTRRATFVLNNRLGERATVYVRHTVAEGYQLTKAPEQRERLGAAHLFRVDVEAGGKAEVVIEESTPLFKSTDLRSAAGMEMVTAYLSSAAAEGPLKSAVGALLVLHREMANTEQQIATTREQMEEYRARMDELHAQIVTLKMVKTAGPILMQSLEKKLTEVSDRLSKATIDVGRLAGGKLMVARIKFQDGVADLSSSKRGPSPRRRPGPEVAHAAHASQTPQGRPAILRRPPPASAARSSERLNAAPWARSRASVSVRASARSGRRPRSTARASRRPRRWSRSRTSDRRPSAPPGSTRARCAPGGAPASASG